MTDQEEQPPQARTPQEQLEEIRQRLAMNPNRLVMSTVPLPTKQRFIEFANTEFNGDYGMALKWLVDGILRSEDVLMKNALIAVQQRVKIMEEKVQV